MQNRLFFNIQTEANPQALPLMPEPTAPGNLKDPEKIRVAIEERRAEQIATAALDPDYGRIICLTYMLPEADHTINAVVGSEEDILCKFWQLANACSGRLAGWNILGFAIPYILRRTLAHRRQPPIQLNLSRYRTDPITDLMAILYNWEPRTKSLNQVAALYGMSDLHADITGPYIAGSTIDQVQDYGLAQLYLTIQLFCRMNGIYFNL